MKSNPLSLYSEAQGVALFLLFCFQFRFLVFHLS